MLDSRFQGGSTGSNPVGDTRKNASDQVRHLVSCVQCKPHALSEPAGSETAAAALDVAAETEHELGPRRWLEVRVVEPVVTQQPGPRISTRRTVSAQNASQFPREGQSTSSGDGSALTSTGAHSCVVRRCGRGCPPPDRCSECRLTSRSKRLLHWAARRASGMLGSNSSMALPEGSSSRTCFPPTPSTISLRK